MSLRVATLGADVPLELVCATGAGLVPPGHSDETPDFVDGGSRALARRVGALVGAGAELILISRETDELARAHDLLVGLQRVEPDRIPGRIELVDVVHGDTAAHRAYNAAEVRRLVGVLPASADPSRDPVAVALSELTSLTDALRALRAIRAATPPRDWTRRLIEAVSGDPGPQRGATIASLGSAEVSDERVVRVHVTGSPAGALDAIETIEAIEGAGGRQVGEDATADLLDATLADDADPAVVLGSFLARRGPGRLAQLHPDERGRRIVERAQRDRADLVLLRQDPDDLLVGWDVPLLRAALRGVGVEFAIVQAGSVEGIRAAVRSTKGATVR